MPNSYCCLLYHVIFSTKHRNAWLTSEIRERVFQYLGGVVRGLGGVPFIVGGVEDHTHILLTIRQDVKVSDLLRILKSKSSGWMHSTFVELPEFAWQRGYGAFTVSISQKDRVVEYITNQEIHHRHEDFRSEFRRFLVAHGIPFDERYIWD